MSCQERSGAVSSTSQATRPGTVLSATSQLVISDHTTSRARVNSDGGAHAAALRRRIESGADFDVSVLLGVLRDIGAGGARGGGRRQQE